MAWFELFTVLHLIGLAFGLGGATAAAIVSAKAGREPELNAAAMKIVPAFSKLIWLGLLLLIISGIGISFLAPWPIDRQLLLVKHVAVALIVVFGIIIGINSKKLAKLAPKPGQKPSAEFLITKKLIKVFGMINLVLWYITTIMSVFL